MHNLQRRIEALEQGAGTGDREAVDVTVHHVHAGGVTIMTPAEWEQYRREHADKEFLSVPEFDDGTMGRMGIVPRWDGGTRIKQGKRWRYLR